MVTTKKIYQCRIGTVVAEDYSFRVVLSTPNKTCLHSQNFDFNNFSLKLLLSEYLFADHAQLTASTIVFRCRTAQLIAEFQQLTGTTDITPETAIAFFRWLRTAKDKNGKQRFSDSTLPSYARDFKRLYKTGIACHFNGWDNATYKLIEKSISSLLRGCRHRAIQQARDQALTRSTFDSLLAAIRLEYLECQKVLDEYRAGKRKHLFRLPTQYRKKLDPNPYVIVALLLALRHGFRAVEFNTLTSKDLIIDLANKDHKIYVHPPNKPDSFVLIDQYLIDAWRMAEAWNEDARRLCNTHTLQNTPQPAFVEVVFRKQHGLAAPRLNTVTSDHLNKTHLPSFFEKYFLYQVDDGQGCSSPLLHAQGDQTRPFDGTYSRLRSTFAVRLAETTTELPEIADALRHRSLAMTDEHYYHVAQSEANQRVHHALYPFMKKIVAKLKNPNSAGVNTPPLPEDGGFSSFGDNYAQ